MAVHLTVDTNTDPLHADSSTNSGKFYDAVVVEVQYIDNTGNGRQVYLPCFNWGSGYPGQFGGGSITLDRFYNNVVDARKAMASKVDQKNRAGYITYGFPRTSAVTSKLRQKIEALVTSSLAIQHTATPAPSANQGQFVKAPSQPHPNAPRPGSTTSVVTDKRTEYVKQIETLATNILTCPDLDEAVIQLGRVRLMVADARAELEQAEDAFEMANAFVSSRLNR